MHELHKKKKKKNFSFKSLLWGYKHLCKHKCIHTCMYTNMTKDHSEKERDKGQQLTDLYY